MQKEVSEMGEEKEKQIKLQRLTLCLALL